MYHRGTLEQFNNWHEPIKIKEGLPIMGYVNGVPAPENQWTVAYSSTVKNPNGTDDYIWNYGAYPTDLPIVDVNDLGWFKGD